MSVSVSRMRVAYAHDGDTIGVYRPLPGGRVEQARVRLAWIDAPEVAQAPFGPKARAYLRSLLAVGEDLEVRVQGTDQYGRLVAEVIRIRSYANVGLRLVLGGYAALWRCPAAKTSYLAAEEIARSTRAGIWAVSGLHQTPWLYR